MPKRRQERTEQVAVDQVQESPKFRLASVKQRNAVKQIRENYITLLVGPAGSGKTLMACYAGIYMLQNQDIQKIVVARLATQAEEENVGFLPGELPDKLMFITNPLYDNLCLILPTNKIDFLLEKKAIEAIPVGHMRGRSFHNTLVIVEECQNLKPNQIKTILSRIGPGSKIVLTGDPDQVDFHGRNGALFTKRLLTGLPGCGVQVMDGQDILRHPVIEPLLNRCKELENEGY